MEIKQVWELANTTAREVMGEEATILKEDLTNVVDFGDAIFNANSMDKYVNALVDHIGKVVFVARKYTGRLPSMLRTAWEYGATLEKVRCNLIKASENESWELTDGASYDENIFNKPEVSAKFYNKRITFEVDISITDLQVKSAFSSPQQLGSFVDMIFMQVENSLTIYTDNLIMRGINSMIGETLHDGKDTPRAINLLKKYNTKTGLNLTADKALMDADFLKFASRLINTTRKHLSNMTKIFNVGQQPRHTPSDLLHIVLLDQFADACSSYLESNTFHKELVTLPMYEEISLWQGIGEDFEFDNVSKINIKTPMSNVDIEQSGIVGVMFDNEACVVSNLDKRVKTKYNNKAEFTNYFYKNEMGLIDDLNENFVVFYIADNA